MYQLSLEDLVPQDNFYRLLDRELDLGFLYRSTAHFYGAEGQDSIDPVVFFKICLVGYLNNINSDRKLIQFCANALDIRLYLRYDIDELLPWHSTISRTRQRYGEHVFLHLFRAVLKQCIDKGMVRGKRQAVDSAFIKANASMDSLIEKQVLDDAQYYAQELAQNNQEQQLPHRITKVSATRKKLVEKHHAWKQRAYKNMPGHNHSEKYDEQGNLIRPRFLSNHTHYSPTDPDARISTKPGKPRQLNYYGQLAVDDAHHVITAACADFADKRDSQCLEQIVSLSEENLSEHGLQIGEILADAAYSSGESLDFLNQNGIEAWMPNFGQYVAEREGFVFNKEENRYECIKDGGHKALLTYKGEKTDSKGYRKNSYRSSEKVCGNCPLRIACCGNKTRFKKIDDSIHKALFDKMHRKLKCNPNYAKKMSRIRSKTVEPVLGTLLNFLNMRRINARGIKQANKHVLLAATCYNLKKYLRFISKHRQTSAQAVNLAERRHAGITFSDFLRPFCTLSALMENQFWKCLCYT